MASTRTTVTRGTFGLTAQAAQVVAWHNRHPLARRIRPDHVHGVGWVLFPFTSTAGGVASLSPGDIGAAAEGTELAVESTLRERAMYRTQVSDRGEKPTAPALVRSELRPAFSEELLRGVSADAVAAFVKAHGRQQALTTAAMPRREAMVDSTKVPNGAQMHWLYVESAAIEAGARRTRVLMSADGVGAVLGRRLLSRFRLALLALVPLVLVSAVIAPWHAIRISISKPATGPTQAAPSTASAQSNPSPRAPDAHHAAMLPATVSASGSAAPEPVKATGATLAAATLKAASGPGVSTQLGSEAAGMSASAAAQTMVVHSLPPAMAASDGVSIRPRIDPELARTARRESAAIRSERTVNGERSTSSPGRAQGPGTSTAFALVARTTRSRAAAEVLLVALTAEAGAGSAAPKAEVLIAEGGYRASLWPFAQKVQAEQAQQRLRAAGLETQLLEF